LTRSAQGLPTRGFCHRRKRDNAFWILGCFGLLSCEIRNERLDRVQQSDRDDDRHTFASGRPEFDGFDCPVGLNSAANVFSAFTTAAADTLSVECVVSNAYSDGALDLYVKISG